MTLKQNAHLEASLAIERSKEHLTKITRAIYEQAQITKEMHDKLQDSIHTSLDLIHALKDLYIELGIYSTQDWVDLHQEQSQDPSQEQTSNPAEDFFANLRRMK